MKKSVKNDEIVTTGQYLGVVEEFLPDKLTTYVKEGNIFASKTGLIHIDEKRREIEVKTHQERDRKTVKIGDYVIGAIVFMRKYSVGLNFFTINNKVHFNSGYFGNIHFSNISNRYVKEIQDAFQVTDIVRAKVIKQESSEYYLTTDSKNLGVIHADCMYCGTALEKTGSFNKLNCPFCGSMETRKLAGDYGNVIMNLVY